jgi:hypothetical protein
MSIDPHQNYVYIPPVKNLIIKCHPKRSPKDSNYLIHEDSDLKQSTMEQRFLTQLQLEPPPQEIGMFEDILRPKKPPKSKYQHVEAKVNSVRSLENLEQLCIVEKPHLRPKPYIEKLDDDTGLQTKRPSNSILVIKEKVDKEIAEGNIKADVDDQQDAEQQLQKERFKELSNDF